MGPGLNDLAVVHYVDDVGVHGSCEAVRDDEGRAPFINEPTEALEPAVFRPGIQRACRLVQDNDRGSTVVGPRQRYTLPLAAAPKM